MTNPRIERLFEHTKLMCFGRYVLTVPVDSRLAFGRDFPTLPNQAKDIEKVMEVERAKILARNKTAEINYFGRGPAPDTWLIRSYKSDSAKELELEGFRIYHVVGPHIFVNGRGTDNGATAESILRDTIEIAQNLRAREPDEVPTEQGLCHEFGFRRLDGSKGNVLTQVGLHMAALPDVVFSVESNQTINAKFSGNSDGLLKLIADQKRETGSRYPKLTTLREGKKKVHGWDGEESLVRRPDGTQDFEWMFIGKNGGSVARPGNLSVAMRTKVEADRIGAAKASSLNDEEAIALWDKLLDGLKFRVAVPGAPADAVAIK
ncbi:T6SS immunity protein Tli4 family protein [Variovorax paradoxus]|uniref:T6SS immunity protein Tli4 family protein n=1 Tax=Variovorax paradoxus TaxID=34073 RepID=UPI0021ABA2CD|nr:T6SS immunity protein Tli4 family protein [Variovorax paradoxus]UVH56334.1 T6SS immunity protein Tli4 family protein [Variovorax paradoxus]